MHPGLEKFTAFLDRNKIRATYGAVADAAGVLPRSVGRLLGVRCRRASWVVNAATGEPTGYSELEKHPDLHTKAEIITTGDLIRRMKGEQSRRTRNAEASSQAQDSNSAVRSSAEQLARSDSPSRC